MKYLLFALAVTIVYGQDSITTRDVLSIEKIVGLQFNEAKRESLLNDARDQLNAYISLRSIPLPNSIVPSIQFNPIPMGTTFAKGKSRVIPAGVMLRPMPSTLDSLAFFSVGELGHLIQTRKVTSEQLTRMYLARIKKYGPMLECIVTVTESLAISQARRADSEIASGISLSITMRQS